MNQKDTHVITSVDDEGVIQCTCGKTHYFTERAYQVYITFNCIDAEQFMFLTTLGKFVYVKDYELFLQNYGGLFH